MTAADIEAAILRLCAARGDDASICPSEVARALAADETAWRTLMPAVRTAAARLTDAGRIVATQRGAHVDIRTVRGPIRLRVAANPEATSFKPLLPV